MLRSLAQEVFVPGPVVSLSKEYVAPTLTARTIEQAILFLVGYAWLGDRNARGLLVALFPVSGRNDIPPMTGDLPVS